MTRRSIRLGSLLIALAVALPRVAAASPSLTVGAGDHVMLGGAHAYSSVVIEAGARLLVKPAALGGAGAGTLHLVANTIHVAAGGTIDGRGAGFAGADGMPGGGPGGGEPGAAMGVPGGGGAFFGAGDAGRDAGCAASSAKGGMPYGMPGATLLGSAGGAAFEATLKVPSLGGAGGGHVILEAAQIVIDGTVSVRGADGLVTADGVASGAGAAGAIEIFATDLSGNGSLLATGGRGGAGVASNGGGGGGGHIVITASSMPPSLAMDVAGGSSGACMKTGGSGPPPMFNLSTACLDADGDGAPAAVCGGTDCDDSDADRRPGLPEICDGLDNDCNGEIDDGAMLCESGSVCMAGRCVVPPPPTPPDPGSPPDHVALEGGCAVGEHRGDGAFALVLLALAALAIRRSR